MQRFVRIVHKFVRISQRFVRIVRRFVRIVQRSARIVQRFVRIQQSSVRVTQRPQRNPCKLPSYCIVVLTVLKLTPLFSGSGLLPCGLGGIFSLK